MSDVDLMELVRSKVKGLKAYQREFGWHAVWSHEFIYPSRFETPEPVLDVIKGYLDQSYKAPASGKFNAGQKMAGWAALILGLFMAGTGIAMWFPFQLGRGLQQWMYFLHNLGFIMFMGFFNQTGITHLNIIVMFH